MGRDGQMTIGARHFDRSFDFSLWDLIWDYDFKASFYG
jgi:hypothetical protein